MTTNNPKKKQSTEQQNDLLDRLQERFDENKNRHPGVVWTDVKARLDAYPEKLSSLFKMERTGGEPDVVDYDETSGEYVFFDCATETPEGRRSMCYDRQALESRKKNQPEHNAIDMAAEMGIELLTEGQYQMLQELEAVDRKTSTWLKTPREVRELGGALFGDFRYGRVFIYHNGAQSYYKSRGFRGVLRV